MTARNKQVRNETQPAFVNSFARGLLIIQAFGRDAKRLTISEVAKRTDLDRAVVRRLLMTLCQLGFAHSDGKYFELTARILTLGHSYIEAKGFIDSELESILNELSNDLQEAVSLTVMDGTKVLFIKRCDVANRRVKLSNVGESLPALVSASGRLFLSLMKDEEIADIFDKADKEQYTKRTVTRLSDFMKIIREIRAAGYSLVDQELEEGLLSLSAPVKNRKGELVAAVNVSSISSRMTNQRMVKEFLPKLHKASARISDSLQ